MVVDNVTKQYGDFTAVDSLSFEVKPGRIFGFLGPNGAGKSTTIRMIVGITYPDSGSISLFGEKVTPETQDRIGYLPEERGLYKKMKIVDQLRYFAALKGVSKKEADRKIDFWLDRVKLAEWRDKKTTDLSKGMAQKLQFTATMLHDPDLIILDEPFSGLDPVNVEFMKEVIAEVKSRDKTIIFSTHLMETAEKLCDDILLINKSKKVLSGSLREVKRSFGQNVVAIRCEADSETLSEFESVDKIIEHADESELVLTEGANGQKLLRQMVERGISISKYEMVEPSLNDIFISNVNEEAE